MKKPTIIHIGYHKTGTTYLQKNVFENNPKLFNRVPQPTIRNTLILPSPLRYDSEPFETLCLSNSLEKRLVISNEYISSNIHNGDYMSAITADRLKQVIPSAKIIIGIREQVSMITSAYSQYIKARGSLSIRDYLYSPISKLFNFNHLQYHSLIEYYMNLYGKENILILPYEVLKTNPRLYLKTVFEFIEEPDLIETIDFDVQSKLNPSMSSFALQVKRFFNPFIMQTFPGLGKTLYFKPLVLLFSLINRGLKLFPLKALDKKIEENIRSIILEEISDRYEYSNRQTQNYTSFDLNALGYRL